jgi:hypothetical protein
MKRVVNRAQKILTLCFLALFLLTLVWFPWLYTTAEGSELKFHPVFLDYNGSPDWFKIRFEWASLVVLYVGLWAVLKG